MAPSTVTALFEHAELRRSVYSLTKNSPIPDARIQEIVEQAVKHAPSAFNVQSARAVLMLHADHEKLWEIADNVFKSNLPEEAYLKLKGGFGRFKGAYGTVLWFEDQVALDSLRSKNPGIQHVVPEWSDHSSGIHQYIVWTALSLEGLGANLQHYNFEPKFAAEVKQTWNLPEEWNLKAQLVFGEPLDGLVRRRERTYLPLEERVKVFGA